MLRLWIFMIILRLQQAFEDISGSNKSGFWRWHGCICYGCGSIMASYASIMPEYASLCLSMAEHCWMSLSMPENACIYCSYYARVLNILPYSYNNIIIIATNVIIIRDLVCSICTSRPSDTISSFFNTS